MRKHTRKIESQRERENMSKHKQNMKRLFFLLFFHLVPCFPYTDVVSARFLRCFKLVFSLIIIKRCQLRVLSSS